MLEELERVNAEIMVIHRDETAIEQIKEPVACGVRRECDQ